MNDQNLVLWAFLHRLSENTKTAITFCKNKKYFFFFKLIFFVFNSGRARVNRAGRKPVRAGHSVLRNRPNWNTVIANCNANEVVTNLYNIMGPYA